jgi:hypothetical protein
MIFDYSHIPPWIRVSPAVPEIFPRKNNLKKRKIIIDDREFLSIESACEATGWNPDSLRDVLSKNKNTYKGRKIGKNKNGRIAFRCAVGGIEYLSASGAATWNGWNPDSLGNAFRRGASAFKKIPIKRI